MVWELRGRIGPNCLRERLTPFQVHEWSRARAFVRISDDIYRVERITERNATMRPGSRPSFMPARAGSWLWK